MGKWKWRNNWGKDDLPEDPKCNSQDDEWEKWRREVDRPSASLVWFAILLAPLWVLYSIMKEMGPISFVVVGFFAPIFLISILELIFVGSATLVTGDLSDVGISP